jgi:hypothetical protein
MAIQDVRHVYMVLSPRALSGYAELCLRTLAAHASEALKICLITDSPEDRHQLETSIPQFDASGRHQWRVLDKKAVDERADAILPRFEYIRALRAGHPCWRKVTDPALIANPDEEMILLDPDVLFPNQFTFETTPQTGLLLMWQKPNCLFPPETVWRALKSGIKLADHVDIGVAQLQNQLDWAWLDWLVGMLGGRDLPSVMHIEALIWSAMLMAKGGGHLNPSNWICWRNSQTKRLLLKAGVSGARILRKDHFESAKCFHAGGRAKDWLNEAWRDDVFVPVHTVNQPTKNYAFTELTIGRYRRQQTAKDMLRYTGYYRISGG